MAATISRYNHTLKLLLNKELTLSTFKLMLLSSDASFDATATALAAVSNTDAYEVDGNGWPTGGETLTSVAVTVTDTDGAKLDADDISVTASGGAIGPASAGVIYDDTGDLPLWYIDFGVSKQADDGTDFNVTFNAAGILTVTDPA